MTTLDVTVPHDEKYCGKKTRAGTPCTQAAGWGTLTPGFGPCKLHGGKSLVKHGRYSKTKRKALGKEAARLAADPDPLNLFAELGMARALFRDFLDRKPEDDLDVEGAMGHVEAISRIVKRIEDIRAQDAISRPEMIRVMTEMGRNAEHRIQQLSRKLEELVPASMHQHLQDLISQTQENLADDWLRIHA